MSTPGKHTIYTIGHSTHSLDEFMGVDKAEEHSYTSPARVIGDRVYYSDHDLFNP